ncbi:hypothetical protein GCM10009716_23080 [Streptomyces sodiiphilus]|uniref:SHSP domain-containing protein n=1 Tax=Streptomyces sodiiphilus TaxID=226217 RepID=A0ABN2P5H7_9ACTN
MSLPLRRAHRAPVAAHRPAGWPARDPLTEFDDLFERMGALLETAVGSSPAAQLPWVPPADFTETENAYEMEVEMPGVRREDIDIELGEQEICISGEFREREHEGALRRGTRRTGRFEYRTTLPAQADTDNAAASLSDGLLTVKIPKTAETRPRHIEITSG